MLFIAAIVCGVIWRPPAALDARSSPASRLRGCFRTEPSLTAKPVDPCFGVKCLPRNMIDVLAGFLLDVSFDIAPNNPWSKSTATQNRMIAARTIQKTRQCLLSIMHRVRGVGPSSGVAPRTGAAGNSGDAIRTHGWVSLRAAANGAPDCGQPSGTRKPLSKSLRSCASSRRSLSICLLAYFSSRASSKKVLLPSMGFSDTLQPFLFHHWGVFRQISSQDAGCWRIGHRTVPARMVPWRSSPLLIEADASGLANPSQKLARRRQQGWTATTSRHSRSGGRWCANAV